MTSRLLGLVREQVLASLFGASHAMDAYVVAFRVPSLLRDLFAEGAMSAAFVPTFTRHLVTEGRPSAWRLGNNAINALLVTTGVLVVLGIVFADPLVRLLTAADFARVPGKIALTVTLARIMLPLLSLIALAAAVMGMLNSLQHFFVPALAPAMFNVVTIAVALAVVPFASTIGLSPITLIALSTVGGGVAQVGLQAPILWREGFRWRPRLDWRDEGLRRILVLMGPGTLGLAATQVNLVVNQLLATREAGAPSWLAYAFRIMYLPIGLFGVSIGTAVLPAISRQLAVRDRAAARQTVADGLSLMMMLNVPATAGLAVLATPIVRLLFERGRFTASDTAATAGALQFYAIGLLGYAVVRIVTPAFYALGRNRIPVLISVTTVAISIALNVILMRAIGFRGLALGTSIAALFNAGALFVLLQRELDGVDARRLVTALAKIGMASAAMAAATVAAHQLLEGLAPGGTLLAQLVQVGGSIGVALVVLAACAWLLRIPEFFDVQRLLTSRWRRRP